MSKSLGDLHIGSIIRIIKSGRVGTKVSIKGDNTKLDFVDFGVWVESNKLEGEYFEIVSEAESDFLSKADSAIEIDAETNFDLSDIIWKEWVKGVAEDLAEELDINPMKAIRELVDHTVSFEMIGTTCMYVNLYEEGSINIRVGQDDIVFEISACTFNGLGIDEINVIAGVMLILETNRDYFDDIMGWE